MSDLKKFKKTVWREMTIEVGAANTHGVVRSDGDGAFWHWKSANPYHVWAEQITRKQLLDWLYV